MLNYYGIVMEGAAVDYCRIQSIIVNYEQVYNYTWSNCIMDTNYYTITICNVS